MTPEEAIKTIQVAIAEVEWNYPMDYAEAFETAINALEKQVPKKPNIKKPTNDLQICHCPACNNDIISRLYGEWCAGRFEKHCNKCGQALDWRDTE